MKPSLLLSLSGEISIEDGAQRPDSNVLITLTQGGIQQNIHYRDGNFAEIDPINLLDNLKPEPLVAVKAGGKIFGRALHVAGYSTAVILLLFSFFSMSGALKARIVLTGSMAPAINTGDLIITTPISHHKPVVGDVVAYEAKRFNGAAVGVFSHRVVGGNLSDGLIVKGDANKLPDSQRPKAADVLGVVVFVIPFVGKLLSPKALFLLVPSLFGLWLIVDAMKSED